jgi:hypothetical protein
LFLLELTWAQGGAPSLGGFHLDSASFACSALEVMLDLLVKWCYTAVQGFAESLDLFHFRVTELVCD